MATDKSKKRGSGIDAVEWVIAFLGMALLASALGFILYRAIAQESKPASLLVSVESVERSEQGYRVDFSVRNTGTQTAASVIIEGELSKNGQSIEKSSATLAYAPAESTRRGGIYFTHDPASHEMKLRAAGFEKP